MRASSRLLLVRLFTFIFFIALGVSVSGQVSTTSLRGAVTDPSGASLVEATITLDSAATGQHIVHTSDAKGEYQFQQVQPGEYLVTVTAAGFGTQTAHEALLVNQPATLNFTLSAGTTVTVNVSADNAALNTTDATMGEALDNATIEALPSEGRNVPALLSLQPGVLYLGQDISPNDSRSGASSGSRSDQGNVTLDGLDDNSQIAGYAFTGVLRPTLDSVQEFRVTTTGSNADTGRSSGAQVDIVTRSGTNNIHGSVYEYNRARFTAANDWFNKYGELSSGLPNVPGQLIRNTFGGALGGPIRKDKLFYFFNYESQRTAENKQENQVVPAASLRAGNISYVSGGTNVSLTPTQVASMDPKCRTNGTCPWGPGDDPNSLAIFNQFPAANNAGLGDGLNTAGYTWSAPNPLNLNTTIGKLDYVVNATNRLFVRANLQDDTQLGLPQFPGQHASSTHRDNTKGIAVGEIWSPTGNLVNNFRYGYARQGFSTRGVGQSSYVNFGSISNINAETRDTLVTVPVHNAIDDITWTRGRHTLQFGANYRLVHNGLSSNALSYDSAGTYGYDVTFSGVANTGQSFDPAAFGFPAVDGGFAAAYNLAVSDLAGLIPQVTNQYNYTVSHDGSAGTLASQGAFVGHMFKATEFEYYLQDSWRVRSNLTISFGLRHTLLQTPYEVNGQQVQTTVNLHDWFATRAADAAQGILDQTNLSFAPSGQARGLKPYWAMQKANLAPRLAIAYSPDARTSIRAGFGMFYDHFGQGLVNTFSQYGSFGLQGYKQTPNDALSPDNAPRLTGLHNIPQVNGAVPTSVTYPFTPSADPTKTGFATAVGLDDKLKTPYSFTMNFSVQREISKGFTLEAAYVGRLGRHLLQQADLAQPVDLVDPKSGQDFYSAATTLTKAVYAGASTVANIPYFEDLFPDAANAGADGSGHSGNSATQNIYQNLFQAYPVNASYIQYSLDIACSPGCGGQRNGVFYNHQFNSLFSWTSNGTSNYNAAQVVLRHPSSHGLQMDVSYTFSKSLDFGSDTERSCVQCGLNSATTFSSIANAFRPRENYGVSDFDTTHLITADGVYQLPFGDGQHFAGGRGALVNAVIGGWQLSGLGRWTSGLPFSIIATNGWEVDWTQQAAIVKNGPVKMHRHINSAGVPEAFADPAGLLATLPSGPGLRNPLPGEGGSRNAFRGDGYFGIDSGLAKSWSLFRETQLKFAWEVFNVTNSARFDVSSVSGGFQNGTSPGASFGAYGATLTQPRRQQLSLRYSF